MYFLLYPLVYFQYLLQYYKTLRSWLHPQDWKEIPLVQNAIAFLTVGYFNCLLS